MAYKRIQCKVLLTLFLIINTCCAGYVMEADSLLVRENAHIEKLLMLDVTNEAMAADSILVKATDNYICNFPILKLPFFTEGEIDSILLGKADTGHVHDTSDVTGLHDMLAGKSDVGHDHDTADVNNLSLYLGQKLDVTDTSVLARKIHDHTISDVTGLQDALELKLNIADTSVFVRDPELNNYYTKTNLQTSGQSQVHAGNITNAPWLTGVNWDEIGGNQSLVNVSGFNNDAGYLDTLPIHDHTISNVTGLQDALDLKLNISDTSVFVRDPELDNYYTKTNLSTSGQSSVHWNNITNEPAFITGVNWNEIGGDQSLVNVSGFNNDAGYLTSLPSHDHDTRYYTKTDLQTSGQASVHAGNITNVPWLTSLPSHDHDTADVNNLSLYLGQKLDVTDTSDLARKIHDHTISDVTGLQDALDLKLDVTELNNYYTKTNLSTSGQSSVHWGNVTNKPTVFPPASHNHSASNITSGTLSNSRLSFNPDYFVQGETIRRSCNYGASNPLDNNNVSAFYTLSPDDPSNPPISAYGIHINSANANGYGLDIIGKGNQNKILWSGIDGGTRQPWREIWHGGNLDTSDYYTKTNLQTSGQASVHWGNVTNKPTEFPPEDH